ncbi:MAG: M81 family metallopeptidase, partial [Pseudolabrys sp.]|nr:M81 family metallopeptidase [Pseudolabrys sp.]
GEALDRAVATRGSPVVIADGADNVGGGAASDSTFVLQALKARRIANAGVGIIWDPDAVRRAAAAGPGASLRLEIGGRHGAMSGPSFIAHVRVLGVADDVDQDAYFERAGWGAGAAAVEADGVVILLSGVRRQFVDPNAFRQFGVDPTMLKLVVVKSMQHFHERFAPIAADILYARTPGSVSQDFEGLPYRSVRGPIWPLDTSAAVIGAMR